MFGDVPLCCAFPDRWKEQRRCGVQLWYLLVHWLLGANFLGSPKTSLLCKVVEALHVQAILKQGRISFTKMVSAHHLTHLFEYMSTPFSFISLSKNHS